MTSSGKQYTRYYFCNGPQLTYRLYERFCVLASSAEYMLTARCWFDGVGTVTAVISHVSEVWVDLYYTYTTESRKSTVRSPTFSLLTRKK